MSQRSRSSSSGSAGWSHHQRAVPAALAEHGSHGATTAHAGAPAAAAATAFVTAAILGRTVGVSLRQASGSVNVCSIPLLLLLHRQLQQQLSPQDRLQAEHARSTQLWQQQQQQHGCLADCASDDTAATAPAGMHGCDGGSRNSAHHSNSTNRSGSIFAEQQPSMSNLGACT